LLLERLNATRLHRPNVRAPQRRSYVRSSPDNGSPVEEPIDERELAELAYTLSLRTLGQQEASLNELRARTGTLLAAAALVASFLGATAIARDGFDVWTACALIALVASVVFAARVLLPQGEMIFSPLAEIGSWSLQPALA
jgi:hypothetical protein